MPDAEKARSKRLRALYSLINGLLVPVTLLFGFFCYENAGVEEGWACYRQVLLFVVLPTILCTVAGLILYFARKYYSAVFIAALPTLGCALGFVWLLVLMIFN
jgi:hypothetical protein